LVDILNQYHAYKKIFKILKYLTFDFRYLEEANRAIKWASTKLVDKGFVYKYDFKMILDDSVKCGRRMGDLSM